MKKISFVAKIKNWVSAHKIASIIILILVIALAYYIYSKTSAANAATQYVMAPARIGTITQTVTGSGQVLAENQLDVTSETSGKIQSITATVGQHVNKGQLLATLDAKDALITLESARLAYAKLVKPAKAGDVINSQNTVIKSYTDGFNAASSLYLDLPTIMSGVKDMFYESDGFMSDKKVSYMIPTARAYRETALNSYDRVAIQYQQSVDEYKSLSRSSATTSINLFIQHSSDMAKAISSMLQNVQNTLTFIATAQPDYFPTALPAAAASVSSWSGQINSDLSSIVSSQNSITSSENSLKTLIEGAEDLDIQSQRLSLQQAEATYAKYFVRAPFDGIVGRIPVSQYGQASASTIIATIIGDQKIANISLNEVDAAKVQAGQTVNITFDAIDGLNAIGTVGQVDLVGTVSQGVVSYNVKVIITTVDERIKPGMSINISIVTKEKAGVLIVPSSAIKTQGGKKYVETLPVPAPASTSVAYTRGMNATTTFMRNSVATGTMMRSGSSTQSRTVTITSATAPTQIPVTTGDTDDTNTEIVTGLERGQFVVTRTIAAGTATAATPNILSSIGGNRNAGGATRAAVRPAN
jgi:HlyD family secretion protein